MRKKCQKIRSKNPDLYFCEMINSEKYNWMKIVLYDKDEINTTIDYNQYREEDETIEDMDEDEQYDEYEEEYEDELTKAQKRAGFYRNDDGEYDYIDDYNEE